MRFVLLPAVTVSEAVAALSLFLSASHSAKRGLLFLLHPTLNHGPPLRLAAHTCKVSPRSLGGGEIKHNVINN